MAAAGGGEADGVTQLDAKFISHHGTGEGEGAVFMHENSVCSMHPDSMDELDVFEHDYVLIKGRKKRATVLKVEQDESIPVGQVGIHQNQRKNLAVSPSDRVFIEPAEPQNLRGVKVAPIAETIEGVTGDLNATFLVPYFQAENRVVRAGDLFCVAAAMQEAWFRVEEVEAEDDKDFGTVRTDRGPQSTALDLMEKISQVDSETDLNEIGYDDIGGLKEQLQKIRETVELPLKHPRLFRTLGVRPPKGVLMHGPPGTGKTMIARAIANETGCIFKTINGPEIMSGQRGGSEKALRDMFQNMEEIVKNDETSNGAILFIDEIDAIAPNRDKTQDETMRRVVATLLTCMDGIRGDVHIMVIGATNRPNSLDPALRRAGRFDTEIVVPVPSKDAREEILQILTKKMKMGDDVDLQRLAEVTHGYVGADLASLCMKGAVTAIRRSAKGLMDMDEEDIPAEFLNALRIDMKDFYGAMAITVASSMRDVVVETPDVKFADIGGLEEVKQEMREMVEMPVKHPEYFEELGVSPPSGALLYGPPGCGKTLIAKAMANECESNFISIKGPQLLTKWFGESEENVREVFDKARQAAPCILFFDELDSIASSRGGDSSSHGAGDSTVNQLLTELDGVGERKNVFVVGATNRPDTIDPALRRPGRLDQLIYIPLPDPVGRLAIFKAVLRKTCVARDVDVQAICDSCDKFTGSDVAGLCQLAVKISVRERLSEMMHIFQERKDAGDADSLATKTASQSTEDWAVSVGAFQKARASTKRSIDDAAMEEYAKHKEELEAQMDATGGGALGDDRVPMGAFTRVEVAMPEVAMEEDDDDIYD